MIRFEHNISKKNFQRHDFDFIGSGPHREIDSVKDDGLLVTEIIFQDGSTIKNITINAYREWDESGVLFIKKYKFVITDEYADDKPILFDDGTLYLKIIEGKLTDKYISEPIRADQQQQTIEMLGYEHARSSHEIWLQNNEYDPECYPIDDLGNPIMEEFCDLINEELWEYGFDEISNNSSTSSTLDIYGQDKVGKWYFAGVKKYISESFNK